jgi:hypothetical protein
MIKKRDLVKKLEDELDFDFDVDLELVNTMQEFEEKLLLPFKNNGNIYYRGERKNSFSRPLLPSIYRDKDILFDDNDKIKLITCDFLYDYYYSLGDYFNFYEQIMGKIEKNNMYSFLAFSQHYLGISPLIDFSKSLYVALSFALKNRTEYVEPILIYTLELKNSDDYTNSLDTANQWIENYSVLAFKGITKIEFENAIQDLIDLKEKSKSFVGRTLKEASSPRAKLIDVPTNDLMRYQQGVFLLLDDFSLFTKSYFTKKIRDNFVIKKWLISKEICPEILKNINEQLPFYNYSNITNLTKTVKNIKNNL